MKITDEQVEIAAEAAWAGYKGFLRRESWMDDEDWEYRQEERKGWPETLLHPDADAFRQAVRDGLNAIGFEVTHNPGNK